MTEDKTVEMPDTSIGEAEINKVIDAEVTTILHYADLNDGQDELDSDIYTTCEKLVKAQDAKAKREIAEWLKNVNHYTSHDKYRGNMLVVRTDDYIRFQEWAAGIGES